MKRREHATIAADILMAIETQRSEDTTVPRTATWIAASANVPFDRLRSYCQELTRLGLITNAAVPRLTERGTQYLDHYHAWRAVQQRFGLLDAAVAPNVAPPTGHNGHEERQVEAAATR